MAEIQAAPRAGRRTEVDAAAVLAPLPGALPAGRDLYDDPASPFSAIADARRVDDGLEQGVWVHDRKVADWDLVIALCQDILAHRSKDVRVAVWLVDGWVHRDGFDALGPAFRLLTALCRAFWPDLYPLIDPDGDTLGRANAISWLNAKLPALIRVLPLTRSGVVDPVSHGWGDYETARLFEARTDRSGDRLSVAAFQASAAATPVDFLRRVRAAIADGMMALDELDLFLDEVCQRQAPSLATLEALLGDILAWIDMTLPAAPPVPEAEEAYPAETPDGNVPAAPAIAPRGGALGSREEAYRRLGEIADYLMRTEPHSPTPYLLRRIQGWGTMSLDELLIDMAHGKNDLAAILELIAPPSR